MFGCSAVAMYRRTRRVGYAPRLRVSTLAVMYSIVQSFPLCYLVGSAFDFLVETGLRLPKKGPFKEVPYGEVLHLFVGRFESGHGKEPRTGTAEPETVFTAAAQRRAARHRPLRPELRLLRFEETRERRRSQLGLPLSRRGARQCLMLNPFLANGVGPFGGFEPLILKSPDSAD